MFTVLMGFAALGIDIGRFYSERRYIQDAVDASALACAYKYAGGNAAEAWAAGDALLQNRNLKANPLGITLTYAPLGSEVYDPTVIEDHNLISGILPVQTNGRGCRVAITADVPTFLIKVISPSFNTITLTTRAYAKSKTGLLPTVVTRYASPPGPAPSDADNTFHDRVKQQGQDWNCSTTTTGTCIDATEDLPGREFVIFGQAAKATNDASFRGFIGLDIRDFTNVDGSGLLIHEQTSPGMAYNLVPATIGTNTLKDYEAAWILEGYPGPDLCVVEFGNFKPCAQVAVINGSSSGQFVTDYDTRYAIDDKLMLQLYDGTVKTVPDFAITSGTLSLPNTGSATSIVQYTFSPQFALSAARVTTTLIPDNGTMTDDTGTASTNPFLNGCATLSSPNVFTTNPTPPNPNPASYAQTWNTITTSGCDKGIFQAWLRGTSSAPYTSRVHETLVNINVGGQARDFSMSSADAYAAIAASGTQADYVMRTTTANSGATKWTGSNLLTLSWAKCPTFTDPSTLVSEVLVCGIDGSFPATSVANVDPGEEHTFSVQTTMATHDGETYKGWVRETGLDDVTNKRVTHLLEITLEVGVVSGGVTQYADILGYAVFKITAINSNDVSGRAITGAYLDPNDPALATGRKVGLVPWETP